MSWEIHEAAKKIADGWYSELEATRKRNAVLGRENARLRSELDSVGIASYLYGRSDLKAENAKLRELVRELWDGYADPPCEDCPLKDSPACVDCPICAREAAVIDRMRELGVEVASV